MGGRGSNFGNVTSSVTPAQDKTINRLANRTRNLKNEQYRIVNEDGEVVLEKRGNNHEVAATVGEKRRYMEGAVSIHNHPDGGTFSDADFSDFGFGARQIVVASPEGNYKMTNMKYGTPDQSRGWLELRNAMDAAGVTRDRSFTELRREAQNSPAYKKQGEKVSKLSNQWIEAKNAGKPQSVLDDIYKKYDEAAKVSSKILKQEERKAAVRPYDEFYKKNASKYGFKYEFTKR